MASAQTCWANSRVGHRIRAPGVAALKLRTLVGSLRLGFFSGASPLATASALKRSNSARSKRSASSACLSKVCNTGSKNAAVLPLPVWLDTSRSVNLAFLPSACASRPCMAFGIVANCTAVGWLKPRSATACSSSGASPSFTKPLGTGATAASEPSAGASQKSGTRLDSTSGVMSEAESEFSGTKSPRASKESVIFFSLITCAQRFWRGNRKLHLRVSNKLRSWLIKHQPSNEYADQALNRPDALTLQKESKSVR